MAQVKRGHQGTSERPYGLLVLRRLAGKCPYVHPNRRQGFPAGPTVTTLGSPSQPREVRASHIPTVRFSGSSFRPGAGHHCSDGGAHPGADSFSQGFGGIRLPDSSLLAVPPRDSRRSGEVHQVRHAPHASPSVASGRSLESGLRPSKFPSHRKSSPFWNGGFKEFSEQEFP